MCGFAGILSTSRLEGDDALGNLTLRMVDTLRHRGPDDQGVWVDAASGIALGFRRLAILDVTTEGHQPMASACGRYVVAFNGEIYNFRDLRKELEGEGVPPLRGTSDTEVLLAAISRWGLRKAIQRFVGMYAFALWDTRDRKLHLVRDRIGEKPLYYGWVGRTFLFGSELKALRVHPEFDGEVDRDSLRVFVRYGYVPGPHCIFKGFSKLIPGTILTINPTRPSHSANPEPYWSIRQAAIAGIHNPFRGSEAEAVERLDALLGHAVGQQMIADVPLGAFLSGGIDSSTIVALMQAQSGRPVETFTIGFNEDGFNEAVYAKAVARHLGTRHTELYVTPTEAMNAIPLLPASTTSRSPTPPRSPRTSFPEWRDGR